MTYASFLYKIFISIRNSTWPILWLQRYCILVSEIAVLLYLLLILINVSIPLPRLQQLLEHLNPLRPELPRIHQLLLMLPPVPHPALGIYKLRWAPLISVHKVHNLFPLNVPAFVLGHNLFVDRLMHSISSLTVSYCWCAYYLT